MFTIYAFVTVQIMVHYIAVTQYKVGGGGQQNSLKLK